MLSEATKALKRFELKLQNHESDLYDLTVFSLRPWYRRVITIISINRPFTNAVLRPATQVAIYLRHLKQSDYQLKIFVT